MSRYVDNYLTYLAEILRAVLTKRPEVMKSSSATLTVEQALSFATLEDMRLYVADRTVTSLSYSGLGDVEEYFTKRLGVQLFTDEGLRTYLREAVLLRNLLTHQRGIVDERSIKAGLPRDQYSRGERIDLTGEEAKRVMAASVLSVLSLDERVAKKFGIPCSEYQGHAIESLSRKPPPPVSNSSE